jgi:hypothetical protein
VLAAVFLLSGLAVYVWLMLPNSSADDKVWARSILTAIASGAIGYVTGKEAAKK